MITEESPKEELGDFFDTLWGDTEGYVYLPVRHSKQRDEWKPVFFEWPEKRDNVIKFALSSSAKGFEVHAAPAIFSVPNPARENVRGSNVLWVDFDGNAPQSWTPESLAARTAAARTIPEPTLRIQSSEDGHEHVYWRLDHFCDRPEWIEGANRSLAYTLEADTSGWDRNQILRPPATTNYKRGLPVTIARNTRFRYPTDSFQSLRPAAQLVSEAVDTEKLPDVEGVVAGYRWDSDHYDLFRRDSVPEGDRSSALMRLGYFCCEAGMSDSEAYAILLHADDRWGKFKGRDDRKRRLLEIVNRARQKHPVGNDELDFRGVFAEEQVELNEEMMYGFRSFLNSEVQVEWLIEGLLERGGLGMVASKPGVGKTQWAIQLACEAALGVPFLGWKVVKPLKVIILSLEMSHVALKLFMETISKHYTEDEIARLEEMVVIVPLGEVLPFDTPEGLAYLEALFQEVNPDLVIVDSIGKTTMKELGEEKSRALNQTWKRLCKKYDTGMWFIHHNRKESENNKKPTKLDDIYGNMYLTADMTSIVILWPEVVPGLLSVIPVKSRLAEMRKEFPVYRDQYLHFSFASTDSDAQLLEGVNAIGNGNSPELA